MQKLRKLFTEHFNKFPPAIRSFLLRALIIFVLWKCIYGFFLEPNRTLDNSLTMKVGGDVAWVLKKLKSSQDYQAEARIDEKWFEGRLYAAPVTRIEYKGKKLMHIADGCNGLELFVLYLGFIFILPASLKRKFAFGIAGIFIIHIINVLRCVGLAFVAIHWRDHFEFAHHYLFKAVVYGIVFLLWVKFTDKIFKYPVHH